MKIYVVPDPNETKREYYKRKFDAKCREVKDWYKEHEVEVWTFGPILLAGAAGLTKFALKRANLRKEAMLKDMYCYDNVLGHYWRLRRKLSNKEWLEIETRKRAGEKLGDILASLRVLK